MKFFFKKNNETHQNQNTHTKLQNFKISKKAHASYIGHSLSEAESVDLNLNLSMQMGLHPVESQETILCEKSVKNFNSEYNPI